MRSGLTFQHSKKHDGGDVLDEEDIAEGFVRERRNLILGASALSLSYLYGIEIKAINAFVFVAEPTQHINLTHLLWVPFLYLMWRYYPYYRLKSPGSWFNEQFFGNMTYYLQQSGHDVYTGIGKKTGEIKYFDGDGQLRSKKYTNGLSFQIKIDRLKGTFQFRPEPGIAVDGHVRKLSYPSEKIPLIQLLWPSCKSLFNTIFMRPEFSEFGAPFILASIPFGFLVCELVGKLWQLKGVGVI